MIETVGSICSGIEAASVAWEPLGMKFEWFSEIAPFPSQILQDKYPHVPNLGDMNDIASKLLNRTISAPDLICGGTPCQAFSFAGWQNGLNDDRGNLTLRFVDIIEANDTIRKQDDKKPTVVFWENVEGVLSDKTNAFGCLVSSLAGLDNIIEISKWSNSGLIRGPKRNVAWRVLDAKFFGLPQQRRRLYLLAGGKDFSPEKVLFESHSGELTEYPTSPLTFTKDGHDFEVFREYTDCLYSAYGTKWNGNAAANNGSLFVVQDNRIRRLSPLECERLMGFPDGYTDRPKAKKTNRYQAIGNSWAVPVIKWIGHRLLSGGDEQVIIQADNPWIVPYVTSLGNGSFFFNLGKDIICTNIDSYINCTATPENAKIGTMYDIVSADAPDDIYISPVGCFGIVRRKEERNLSINRRLEEVLLSISAEMSPEEIEKRSRVQRRGRFSDNIVPQQKAAIFVSSSHTIDVGLEKETSSVSNAKQLSIFDIM